MLDPIKSPLEYFEISKGKAKLFKQGDTYNLSYDNRLWMGYNINNFWQSEEFSIELDLAFGVCITTGLGLGIIQTLLCSNDKVSKIIVFEKNKDIIDIFYELVEKNKFDISKIEIINENADEIKNQSCDCLLLDHFEGESENEILARVSKIENNNTCSLLWYWPAVFHYLNYVEKNRFIISQDSYIKWKFYTKLVNLPTILNQDQLDKVQILKNKYLLDSTTYMQSIMKNFDNRNKLIQKFGRGLKK
jgi:hypothetical protein